MKKIFIYYSLTGNGDKVADYLQEHQYEIRKVNTQETLPTNFILRILSGGYKAMINYEDKLIDFNDNINDYDEIIIGSPIWNSRLSSPINTVLKTLNLENKKLTFILYRGSNKIPKAEQSIKEKYPNAKLILLQEPIINPSELNKINLV